MSTRRPIGVTILAILAAIGAIIAVIHTLQFLHLFPIRGPFGQFAFFTFDLLGAILWGILALIYIWVVRMLWNLNPQGWFFVAALSALELILAVISILGQSTWQAMLPAIVVSGLILIYCLLPGTKEAFGVASGGTQTETSGASATATPVMVAEQREMAEEAIPAAEAVPEEGPPTEEAIGAEPGDVPVPAEETAEPVSSEMETEEAPPAGSMVTGAAATSHDLTYVEGIGEVYGGKLKESGVETPQALLEKGATPQGRKELAEETGISGHLILKWVNHVDLYRIKGLGSEYADLLEAAGVDTVPELAQRNPENLHSKIIEVNEEKHLVRHVPSQSQVEDWVKQAKELPRVITY